MTYYPGPQCRRCGANIEWIKTKNDKNMPVDPRLITIITKKGRIFKGYVPHWITCPHANKFRNQKKPDSYGSKNSGEKH